MSDKPNARELLKEALDRLSEVAMLYQNKGDIDLVKRIDNFFAVFDEDAMEMVRQIRDLESYGGGDYEYYLDATEAAAKIEGMQCRVPRKMLDELYQSYPITYAEMYHIFAKHGYTVKE